MCHLATRVLSMGDGNDEGGFGPGKGEDYALGKLYFPIWDQHMNIKQSHVTFSWNKSNL